MRWWNRYNFPYSNFHDLNLDWIIKEMNRLIKEWETLKSEWEQMKIEWVEFQAEMQRLWDEYQELMNAAWEAYKANLNQEWATYQTNLNNAWNAFQQAMNAWKDSVDQDIQDKFDEIDAKCAECLARVQAALDNLNNVLAEVQQQVTDYLNNLPYETIIHDTTVEWLDEHGVTIEDIFLTPEQFGAVGDGTTDDGEAFRLLAREAEATKKPIILNANTSYKMSAWILRDTVAIYGNNAKLVDCIDFLIGGPNTIVRDLDIGLAMINGLNADLSGLVLDNIKCGYMQLGGGSQSNPASIIIRDVVCSDGMKQTHIGNVSVPIIHLFIDNLIIAPGSTNTISCVYSIISGLIGTEPTTPTKIWFSHSDNTLIESTRYTNLTKTTQSVVNIANYSPLS